MNPPMSAEPHHCRHCLSRREMLKSFACGFASVAFAGLFGQTLLQASAPRPNPLAPRPPHFRPRARSIIFLYMDGGVSQVDSFDYKPLLEQHHGEDPHKAIGKLEKTQFANVGKVMKSPWKFSRRGESGLWVSDLFPHLAAEADQLCVIKSMTSKFPEHTSANYFLHTGTGLQGRPSLGAWATYGLGSENRNLPGFIVLNGGLIPPGGLDNFNSGFLPAAYQGSIFRPGDPPVANLRRLENSDRAQRGKLDL